MTCARYETRQVVYSELSTLDKSRQLTFPQRVALVVGRHPFAWAKANGVSKATMQSWLRSERPQLASLSRLEGLTGIPVDWWQSGAWPPPGWPAELPSHAGECLGAYALDPKAVGGGTRVELKDGSGEVFLPESTVKGVIAHAVGSGKTMSMLQVALAMQLGKMAKSASWLPSDLSVDECDSLVSDALALLQQHYGSRSSIIHHLANSERAMESALRIAWESRQADCDHPVDNSPLD